MTFESWKQENTALLEQEAPSDGFEQWQKDNEVITPKVHWLKKAAPYLPLGGYTIGEKIPFSTRTAALAAGGLRGVKSLGETLNLMGKVGTEYMEQAITGITGKSPPKREERTESDVWKAVKKVLDEDIDFWEDILQKEGASGVDRLMGSAIGGFAPGIVEWMAGVPYAAIKGGAEAKEVGKSALWGGVKEGTKRAILGQALKYISGVQSPVLRRGAGGLALGGAAALEGAPAGDIALQTVMGVALAGGREELKERGIKVSQPLQTKTGLKQYNIELPNGRKINATSFPTPEQAQQVARVTTQANQQRGENVKVEVKNNILTMEEWPKWRTLAPEMATAEATYPITEQGARARPLQRRIQPQLPEEMVTAETARVPTIAEKPPTKAVEAITPAPPPVPAPEAVGEKLSLSKLVSEIKNAWNEFVETRPLIGREHKERVEAAEKRIRAARKAFETELPPKNLEPWQMTKRQFEALTIRDRSVISSLNAIRGNLAEELGTEYIPYVPEKFATTHRAEVKLAVESGKPVPPEVLAEYPDLAKQAPPTAPKKGFRKGAAYIPTLAEMEKIISEMTPEIKPEEAMGAVAARPGFPKKETAGVAAGAPIPPAAAVPPSGPQQILNAVNTAIKERPVVELEKTKERGRRFGLMKTARESMLGAGVLPEEAPLRATAMLRGRLFQRKRFPSIRNNLGQPFQDELFMSVNKSRMQEGEILNTTKAYGKLLDGNTVTETEAGYIEQHLAALDPSLWPQITPEIRMSLLKLARARSTGGLERKITEIINIPYTTLTSADVSGIGRQGLPLGITHPVIYGKFVGKYLKSFASGRWAEETVRSYREHPLYGEAKAAGLEETIYKGKGQLGKRVEGKISSRLLGKIPIAGWLFRAGERGYSTGTDWQRFNVYYKNRNAQIESGKPIPDWEIVQLADVLNDVSMRPKLPRAIQKIAPIANAAFAPRFAWAHIKIPYDVVKLALQGIRHRRYISGFKEAIGASAGLMAIDIGIINLVKWLWPDDTESENDPRATDFGKTKIKGETADTRLSISSGYIPWIRFTARMATGKTKTATGEIRDIDRTEELIRFLQTRRSPAVALVIDALTRKDWKGDPILKPPEGWGGKILTAMNVPEFLQGLSKEAWNRLMSITAQDSMDAFQAHGIPLALIISALSVLGVEVTTYKESPSVKLAKLKDIIAQEQFKMKWDNLDIRQQQDLRRNYPQILESETIRRMERERPEEISLREVNKSHKQILKRLSPEISDEVKRLKVGVGISRSLGPKPGWYLNDQRYQRYQDLTVEEINKSISELIKTDEWLELIDAQKIEVLSDIISDAKSAAGAQLMNEEGQ